jgi:leucyl-tRNA synthetase
VDNEKMSKSKGNFISLHDALGMYGADATRLACADAGDSLDDANFVRETAAGFIMKLTTLIENAKELLTGDAASTFRSGEFNLFDRIFENTMNSIILTTENYYKGMSFRMALNCTFFELTGEFSQYRMCCDEMQMHGALVRRYFEVLTLMLMPLAPHFSEYLWMEVLGNATSVMHQSFPTPSAPVSYPLRVANRVFSEVVKEIRSQVTKNAKKRGPIDELFVYVAKDFLGWQKSALASLTQVYRENNNSFPQDTAKLIISKKEAWMTPSLMQESMAFMAFVKLNTERYGPEALSEVPILNDFEMLHSVLPNVCKLCSVANVRVVDRDDETIAEHKVARSKARPGEPSITFPPVKK